MTALSQYALLEAEGVYFDGASAQQQSVFVKFGEATLTLMTPDGAPVTHWPLATLRALETSADMLRLTPGADSDERLTLFDPAMIAAIRSVCPDLHKVELETGQWRKIILWGGGAIASVLLIVLVLVPAIAGQLAELIPPEQEKKLGEQVVRQIVWFARRTSENEIGFCDNPEGVAALEKMHARLAPHMPSYIDINVRVLGHEVENAFAAPGGEIVLFDGLIQNAESPEEVAGVLAHEIAHVVNRDPARQVLRVAGSAGLLGLLVGDFGGGAVAVGVAETVLNASYSQEAERLADEAAHTAFAAAGLPSAAFADFFERVREKYGDTEGVLSHVASHPDFSSRMQAAVDADVVGDAAFQPVLSDQEWIALRQICD